MNLLRAVASLAAALVVLVVSVGCAGVDRRPDLRAFAGGRYDAARTLAEDRIVEGGPDVTLDACFAGTAALAQGDLRGAHRWFREAFDDLEDLTATTGETAGAIVGPDRSKRWKGDPHERCMNAYYLGVTYWLLGDPDNAAASFKAGLLRDADSEKGAAQSDFALLWYLLGMAQREARHEDRGAQALARARELLPENPSVDPKVANEANVLLVLDVGLGPRKVAAGPHGSQLRFARPRYVTASALVTENGRTIGRTAQAVDVFLQAATRGAKTMDDVNAAKAAVKDAAVVGGAVIASNAGNNRNQAIGLGLVLAGLLLPAETDLRSWDTLPGEVHVLAMKLPLGEHVLRVEPQDSAGTTVAGLGREIRVTVREGHVTFAWLRAAPAPVEDGRIETSAAPDGSRRGPASSGPERGPGVALRTSSTHPKAVRP